MPSVTRKVVADDRSENTSASTNSSIRFRPSSSGRTEIEFARASSAPATTSVAPCTIPSTLFFNMELDAPQYRTPRPGMHACAVYQPSDRAGNAHVQAMKR